MERLLTMHAADCKMAPATIPLRQGHRVDAALKLLSGHLDDNTHAFAPVTVADARYASPMAVTAGPVL